ncbi:MAG: STAS domain-containing protein [Eubacterium sp.]|nr:STAS domain-containing protein [Eubacterium sp.]
MQTSMDRDSSKLTVFVSGRVDTAAAPEFEKTVLDDLDGITDLVLDIDGVEYVSSAGLRAFLQIKKTMSKQGTVKILNMHESVKEIFDMIGFTRLFTIE